MEGASQGPLATRLLALRGEREGGQVNDYLDGFRYAGMIQVEYALVPNAGHFTQEESPDDVWLLIARSLSV